MKVSVNAPSYRRPDKVLTLDYIPYCRIWVDEGEADEYRKNYPNADIVACPNGVQGNLCRVRNYILDKEFERGIEAVLIIDDDLKCLERYVKSKTSKFGYVREKIDADELIVLVEKYSIMAMDMGAYYWGVMCNPDAMSYRHCAPFSTCAYIGGPFQCFIKDGGLRYDEKLPLKEDYDMTLQQLNKHRVVLRVNYLHYICKQSENKGGCATYRNREKEEQQMQEFQKKWGGKIVRRDVSNKGHSQLQKKYDDYNPIIKVPIKGV